jgi:hypothetical protein
MNTNKRNAYWIENALELAMSACDQIKENEQCRYCPMWGKCLDDIGTSFAEVSDYGAGIWEELLELSEESYGMRASDEYDYADMRRKEIQEEELINGQ